MYIIYIHVHEKNISGGARQAILRSLDSAVSSLLALISIYMYNGSTEDEMAVCQIHPSGLYT